MPAQQGPEVDFSKSTNTFPMDRKPEPIFGNDVVDFSKSTNAYPMYDDRNAPQVDARHLSAKLDPQFVTPGPISTGHESVVVAQRASMGLSDDPSGESDAGYEARPSTIPMPGADGVERVQVYERGYLVDLATDDEDGPLVDSDVTDLVESDKKAVAAAEVEAKVVEPAKAKHPQGRARATTK